MRLADVTELILFFASLVLSWALTGLLLRVLERRRHVAPANERSLHAGAVPVGGGMAIIATLLLVWPVWVGGLSQQLSVLTVVAAVLCAVSFLDDLHSLWPVTRLVLHGIAVAAVLSLLTDDMRIAASAPLWFERALVALAWIWFINLYNFMDGIDGLAGSEAAAIAIGYVGVMSTVGIATPLVVPALVLAAAVVGYLAWNWHPARIFMGDAGSIPLGFLLGWLMLDLAFRGQPAAAIILPLYFLVDATATLLRRLLRREAPWLPHREHAYQRAVLAGAGHDTVVLRVIAANGVLVVLALLSVKYAAAALAAALIVVALLMRALARTAKPRA